MDLVGFVLLLCAICLPAHARGRRPDPQEGYPDYNRLEFRKKAPDLTPEPPAPSASRAYSAPPSVDPSTKAISDLDAPPKPPPAAVPIADDDSEPALPDDMLKTLTPPATGQK